MHLIYMHLTQCIECIQSVCLICCQRTVHFCITYPSVSVCMASMYSMSTTYAQRMSSKMLAKTGLNMIATHSVRYFIARNMSYMSKYINTHCRNIGHMLDMALLVSYSSVFNTHAVQFTSCDRSRLMTKVLQCMSKVHLTYIEHIEHTYIVLYSTCLIYNAHTVIHWTF